MGVIAKKGRPRRKFRRRKGSSLSQKRKKIQAMLNKHLHRRWADNEDMLIFTTATGTGPGFKTKELTFQLNHVTQFAELKAMYDQYKINFVEIYMTWSPTLLPVAHTATGGPSYRAGVIPPSLKVFHIADYDDSDPLTLDEFKQRAKTKLTLLKPMVKKKIVVKPAVLSQIYETLTSTGYAPKWNVKLDCNDDSVPHYSYKFGVVEPEGLGSTDLLTLGKIDFEVRYNLTMFNTK